MRRGGKVGFILPPDVETFGVQDGKLIHRLFPVVRRPAPVGRDVAQRQPDQFGGGLVAGEVTARLDDLAQPRMYALASYAA